MRTLTENNRLLEREQELAVLADAIQDATDGRGGVVVISGPAGIGKSRLLEAACERARGAGFRVLRARGVELEREFSFGLVIQWFGAPLRAASGEERADLLSGAARAVRGLFESGEPVRAADEAGAFALLHGLHWLTSNLAERQPLLLVADDLHWADRPSLRFILYLCERVSDLPTLVAAAVRTGEPGLPEDLLRRLRRGDCTRELRPQSLSAGAVVDQVQAQLPGSRIAFAEACAATTGGNPYLLEELLHDLVERQVDAATASPDVLAEVAPARVLDTALERLDRLPSGGRALAEAVAILGDGARLGHAAELAGLDLEAAARPADALRAVHMLATAQELAFVHPLMRSTVYAAQPPAQRATAHLRASRILARDGAPVQVVASHLTFAPPHGDREVVERLCAAAASARTRGDLTAAIRFLRRALDEPPHDDRRARVLIELGEAEAEAGIPGAIERLDAALALLDDPMQRSRLLHRLGWTLQKRGDLSNAVAAFDRGLAELRSADGDEDELARLQAAHLGAALLVPAHAEAAQAELARLKASGARAQTPADRVLLSTAAAQQLAQARDHRAVIDLSERAWADGRLLGDEGADAPAVWHVIGCLSYADALDTSERVIEAVFAEALESRSPHTLALAYFSRAWPQYWRGRLTAAAADAEAAVQAWSGEFSMYLSAAIYWLAISVLELGDIDGAERAVARADTWPGQGELPMAGAIVTAQGAIALERGRAGDAVRLLEDAGGKLRDSMLANPAVMPWRAYLVSAASRAGDTATARAVAEENLALCRSFGAPRALGEALRAMAMVERGETQLRLLREAVDTLAGSPSALEQARALVDLGAALRRQGARTKARAVLRAGMAGAQSFGAARLEQRAHAELTAAGGRPRRRELTGVEALTPSELRVAELAADGLTNREIAQQLFVTLKAVQFHLGNTYRKLGVRERAALGARLGRAGELHRLPEQ